MIHGFSEDASLLEGMVSGTSILEYIEKNSLSENAQKHEFSISLTNELVAFRGSLIIDQLSHECYSKQLMYLGVIADSAELVERIYEAETEEDMYIAGVISAVKIGLDCGLVEGVVVIIAGTSTGPVLLVGGLAACVVSAAFDYVTDKYYEYMETHAFFSWGGFIRFLIDPSGIVYEAVPGNPVEGAEVRVYYLDPETGEQTEWNAADYEQTNPIITEADGAYAWDVPEGKWKVVCTKEGYDTAETEWMDVPPIRTNVMLSMVDHSAPEIAETEIRDDGLYIRFSKYIDISTLTENSIVLKNTEGCTLLPLLHAPEDAFTDAFLITGAIPAGTYTLSVAKTVKSYAGTAAAAASKKITLEHDLRMKGDLNGDNQCTVADLVLMNRMLTEDLPDTDVFQDASVWKAADMNSDGTVTIADIRIFCKLLLENQE